MSFQTSEPCPRCGATLPADAPGELCPRCLMAMHLETETLVAGAENQATAVAPTIEDLQAHFPQLELIECLGRGGMGVVYKARQKSLNREVALKLLAPERANDQDFAERFQREAHALAALNHPNIVTIHDFGEAGGFYYLLMEFVDGVNLRQAMEAGRFLPNEALAIVPPVCEALQFAHEHGIVHRDIKPENLLLDREGRVKIADFGIAKMVGAGVVEDTKVGTPRYMAPEQGDNPAAADHRADIYAIGVVLYELLTGETPSAELIPPSKRVEVDVRLDEIVLRALEQQPELRFATAAEFQSQVEGLANEAPRTGPVKSPFAQMVESFFQVPFNSPAAIRCLNGAALGFFGCLGALGYVALPRSHFLFGLSGFFGFFGLIGVAFALERLAGTSKQAAVAMFFAGLSGVLGLVTLLLAAGQPPRWLIGSILLSAVVSVLLAVPVRKKRLARRALIGASINLAIWCTLLVIVGFRQGQATFVSPSTQAEAEFHYRVFEADPALVDKLIPDVERQPGFQSSATVFYKNLQSESGRGVGDFNVTKRGMLLTDSQLAFVDAKALGALLPNSDVVLGMLSEGFRQVSSAWWHPGLTQGWTYTRTVKALGGTGSGSNLLGFRTSDAGLSEARIESRVTHDIDLASLPGANQSLHSHLLFEGEMAEDRSLIFLIPFLRKDNTPRYLVVNFVIDSAAALAKLPSTNVKLIAVSPQESEPGEPWRPNGAPVFEPFPRNDGRSSAGGKVIREFAFHVRARHLDDFSMPVVLADRDAGFSVMGSSWNRERGVYIQTIACPPEALSCDVRFGMAEGDWETVATVKHGPSKRHGSHHSSGSGEEWLIGFDAIKGASGDFAFACRYTASTKKDETRLVYATAEGELTVVPSRSSSSGIAAAPLAVSAEETARIVEFRLQRRPYDFVEYREVSLQLGHRTAVVAEVMR